MGSSKWIFLDISLVVLLLGVGCSPQLVIKPAQQLLVLQIFPAPTGSGGLGSNFPFWWFHQGKGGSVSPTIITGTQCLLASALRAPYSLHSPLCAIAQDWHQEIILICTLLINFLGALIGSKLCPQSSHLVCCGAESVSFLSSMSQFPF